MKNSQLLVIADSSALVSLISQTDANHHQAVGMSTALERQHATVITPGDIFSETVNITRKKLGHAVAMAAAELMLDSELFVIAEATDDLRRAALTKLQEQPASVSFTDCLVMAFADSFETQAIFGYDEAFRKSGYRLPQLSKAA
jgi:predicted nucleic acid-binding protein